MVKETADQKRARFLAMAQAGAEEFRTPQPLSATAPAAPAPPARRPTPPRPEPETRTAPPADDRSPEDPADAPDEPEEFAFRAPEPSRKSLRKRGWVVKTHLYDPLVLDAAERLARDLGLHFAELQSLALALLSDPRQRTTETDTILQRVRARFT